MDSRTRRTAALWVLAPVSAYALSITTSWAIHHDPLAGATEADATGDRAPDPMVARLHAQLTRETKQFNHTRTTLLQLEREAKQRARQVTDLQRANAARRAAASSGSTGSGGSASYPSYPSSPSGSSGSSGAGAPAPAPAPAPGPAPAPPTQTSTGSS
jgi:uncharacterized membrane protein YgcG